MKKWKKERRRYRINVAMILLFTIVGGIFFAPFGIFGFFLLIGYWSRNFNNIAHWDLLKENPLWEKETE